MIEEFLELQMQGHELEDAAVLGEWLPPAVFDSHVHTSPSSPGMEMINNNVTRPGETFNFFDWKLHRKIMGTILPKQRHVAATFGFPHMPDYDGDNNYILSLAQGDNCVIPIFRANATSVSKSLHEELSLRFAGLKMYPSNGQKKTRTSIIDIFPRSVIGIVNALSKPMIIHLPNGLTDNLEELIALAEEFPCAKFVIAHMGVTYCYESKLEDALTAIKQHTNIFFDTAMVSDVKVISRAIEMVGPERILFGSDAPFSYFRGGLTTVPDGRLKFHSQTKFSWVKDDDRKLYDDKLSTLKLVHLNIILAIKKAIEVLAYASWERAKSQMLWHNSRALFCTG